MSGAGASTPSPTDKPKAPPRRRTPAPRKEEASEPPKKTETAQVPRRAELSPERRALLGLRRSRKARRPRFVRQQSHRYLRIRRRGSWRAPRGVQSKQRRHYGYRPTVVSIGFGSPRAVRGLTPAGFVPVRVENARHLGEIDPKRQAAVIAHGVGVRKRLVLEELARQRGVRVLNPILQEEREEESS